MLTIVIQLRLNLLIHNQKKVQVKDTQGNVLREMTVDVQYILQNVREKDIKC